MQEGDVEQALSTSPLPHLVKFDPFVDVPLLAPLVPISKVNRISYITNPTYNTKVIASSKGFVKRYKIKV